MNFEVARLVCARVNEILASHPDADIPGMNAALMDGMIPLWHGAAICIRVTSQGVELLAD
jgi:hypothetical protein